MVDLRFTASTHGFNHTGDFDGMMAFVRTADELGYDTLRLADHVTLVDIGKHPEVQSPYTVKSQIREIFVLLGYLAGCTRRITLATGVLALPQRQTALVAKQAAEIDLLAKGRFQLGVGLGYNAVEFATMNADFHDRAVRFEEQIDVLRAFWTQDIVDFAGQFHTLEHVNINPRPVQQPIPIWFGTGNLDQPMPSDRILRRIGRLADGWLPLFALDASLKPNPSAIAAIDRVNAYARAAGRTVDRLPLELCIWPGGRSKMQVADQIKMLRDMGASDIHAQFSSSAPDDLETKQANFQIDSLKRFREAIDLLA
ncbi:LLM class F420-dependent oxidoreductase [Flavisphingomonas formosensis]|uniref:LLM class F420-dependent oxidoreductase n=1 Tax=Flavisphingomonas formosensis TaxID=861534 RepID=UPI0012FA5A4C|nr:LLM class F420-dependent oxidoreductase [Sphingomonas formosensis]